ncbi:MAG TPA: hypothetical protein VGF56_15085 [Rhizomicrobium sp.]|jgi:hypothetical protein
MRRILVIASALLLSGCMTPIAIVGPSGFQLHGAADIEMFASSFTATDGTLTCTGDAPDGFQTKQDRHSTITGSVTCSDGRKGVVIYDPDSYSGRIRLTDGTSADIVAGDAAKAINPPAPPGGSAPK